MDYTNTIGLQIEDLRKLAEEETEKCFDRKKLSELMDADIYKGLERVIITGCGDSYSAAGAMLHAFQMHSGLEQVAVPDPMEFCRFYTKRDVVKNHADQEALVIAVSASGGSERIVEILEKGNRLNAGSMLISNNPQSKGAKVAKYVFNVETPDGCNTPGLRSYFASMIAIVALGAYIGLVKGRISDKRFDEIKKSIVEYTLTFMDCYQRIDDQMFELAQAWRNFERFEVVGDWDEGASAQFVEEKFIECAGVHCTHSDSEDWCHINHFARNPEEIGTIFMVNSNAPDFDRMIWSIRASVAIKRPTLVVTDAMASEFPTEVTVCKIPSAREDWLMPIMDFAPGSMLGAYVAAITDKQFFCGRYDFRTQTWHNERR